MFLCLSAGLSSLHIGIAGRPSDLGNTMDQAFCDASACQGADGCWGAASFECAPGYSASLLDGYTVDPSSNTTLRNYQCCTFNLSLPLYCDEARCRGEGNSCWVYAGDEGKCADGYAITKTGRYDDHRGEEYQCCTPQTRPCNATLLHFDWNTDEVLSRPVKALNIFSQDWCLPNSKRSSAAFVPTQCEDDPEGHVAADPHFNCSLVSAGSCNYLDPDFNGVQNIYWWQLCPKTCNRCENTTPKSAGPSAREFWTVNGRVMYRKCGDQEDNFPGKLEMVLGGSMHDPMASALVYEFDMCPPELFAECSGICPTVGLLH